MMNKTTNTFLTLIVLTAFCIGFNKGFAQTDDTSDLESWTSVKLKYKLNKKWAFDLEEQLRLDENSSEVAEYFTEVGAKYSISKRFDLGGGLRFIRENDNKGAIQGYENHFRFHVEVSYKHKIDGFTFKYRLRYQNKNELGVSSSEGDYANQNIRFKTALGYTIKNWKFDPKIAWEIFNHFEKDDENGFSKYRLTIGTEYKFKQMGVLGLFYGIEKEINEIIPETIEIIGLKYTYTIRNHEKDSF